MLTSSRINLVVIISEQTFSTCVCLFVQQKQFGEAVYTTTKAFIVC